jgi:hypothetical protein
MSYFKFYPIFRDAITRVIRVAVQLKNVLLELEPSVAFSLCSLWLVFDFSRSSQRIFNQKNMAPFLGPHFKEADWLDLRRDEELRSLAALEMSRKIGSERRSRQRPLCMPWYKALPKPKGEA